MLAWLTLIYLSILLSMCFVRLFLVLYVDHGDTTEVMEVALSLGGVFWGLGAVKQTPSPSSVPV